MHDIDLDIYVNALFVLMISSVATFLFIIQKLRNEKYPVLSLRFFNLYFTVGIVGWILHWCVEKSLFEGDYTVSVIFYMVVSMLLLQALVECSNLDKLLKVNVSLHALAVVGSLFMANDIEHLLYLSIYIAIVYPLIMFLAFKRAYVLQNVGYGIIGSAALFVTVLVPFQLYGVLMPGEFNVGYGAAIIGSSTGFVLVGIGFLTSMLVNERTQLTLLTLKDPLTGLLNRRGLYQALDLSLSAVMRNQGCLSAVAIDIDHFKKINDVYGHDGGDFALKELSRELKRHARASDACCRLGGEEFVFVMPSTTPEEAVQMAERIRQNIEKTELLYNDQVIRMTSSFGVAAQCGDIDMDYLLKEADKALYQAKAEGRNRVCLGSTI